MIYNSPKELLKGKAKLETIENDMFWSCCIIDWCDFEVFHIKWTGYNDSNWWNNVSELASIVTCKGSEGTERKFKLNYESLDVIEVGITTQ